MPSAETPSRVFPRSLKVGDRVGIIAPASAISRELLQAGCENLKKMGYEPVISDSIFEQELYFAGSHLRRARELEEMFARPDVRAIICARGGYGCNHLLPLIDLAVVRAHPKIFVGYSDVTTLLTYFHDQTGLITFHGPMAAKDAALEDGMDIASWHAAMGGDANWELNANGVLPMVAGHGEGILYGGCLSMLASSLGTPYEIQTKGKLLFIEDVAAKPYQVDRMLMQLKLAGKFDGVAGIIFGEMPDCTPNAEQGFTLPQVILRLVGELGVPIAFGLRSGHVCTQNITLPVGVKALLEVGARVRVRILEAATQSSRATVQG